MFTVADMMTPQPRTLSRNDTLLDAKEMMEKLSIRHIPITDHNNELIGLVSQRDILSAQDSNLKSIIENPLSSTLDVLLDRSMNTNVMSVDYRAGLKQAALYMQKHKIGCLPVVKEKNLIGIITDSDFVAIAITLIETLEEVDPIESDFETLDILDE
ncbi:CBS domain-containing protein [Photobacterium leiognathi]|uniref:CBS domain-containing protein n=1 Tax=Photobacterium leiognathi TaxID=553611 RepID=UPI00298114E9|nr:CBS domain-containing protein [Photobacterium leiognathi]